MHLHYLTYLSISSSRYQEGRSSSLHSANTIDGDGIIIQKCSKFTSACKLHMPIDERPNLRTDKPIELTSSVINSTCTGMYVHSKAIWECPKQFKLHHREIVHVYHHYFFTVSINVFLCVGYNNKKPVGQKYICVIKKSI